MTKPNPRITALEEVMNDLLEELQQEKTMARKKKDTTTDKTSRANPLRGKIDGKIYEFNSRRFIARIDGKQMTIEVNEDLWAETELLTKLVEQCPQAFKKS